MPRPISKAFAHGPGNRWSFCPGCRCVKLEKGERLCKSCQESTDLGMHWKPVYDRARGIGSIPPNLRLR